MGWAARRREALERRDDYTTLLLAAALFGLFTTNFNISVLAVVIPQLTDELDATASIMSWVVVAPMLAFATLGPAAGKLGDLHGRRKVYLAALIGCGLFAAATAAAPNAAALIGFRTISATFGMATAPAGMAIIAAHFPRERRVQALGYWGLVLAGGPVLGMVIGGPAAEAFGWRWLFIVQVPLCLLGLVVAAVVLPESERRRHVRFDVWGTVLFALTAGGLVFAVNRGPAWGWSNAAVVALLVAAPLAGVAFYFHERRCPHALIPVEYFRRRNFAAPMVGNLLVNIAYQGGFVVVPLMLAEVLGYGSGRIALVTMARPLLYGLAGPAAGRLAMRVGERPTAVTGASLVAGSTLLLTTVGAGTGDVMIFGLLALSGAGLGSMVPAITATVTTAVDDRDLGVAGATSQMMLQIGMVLGITVMQTVQETREAQGVGLEASYHSAFLVGALISVGGIVAVSLIRSYQRRAPARPPAPVPASSRPVEPGLTAEPA